MDRSTKPVVVRQVWASNLESEFALLEQILPCYCHVAFDTEFPGFIHVSEKNCHYSKLPPSYTYKLVKANVDSLKLIQLGLALSNYAGHLPDLGTDSCYVWEFNFKGFDVHQDHHNPDAIQLLAEQGIDFAKIKEEGIPIGAFRRLFLRSRFMFSRLNLTWVTFHSSYDFGYMVKVLTGRKLPNDLDVFKVVVSELFGSSVYDMKHMIKFCRGINVGGLEKLAKSLKVDRVAGNSHQAGSDSLLTLQTFFKLRDFYFTADDCDEQDCLNINSFANILFGL
ncbi:hypothetical protein HN51_065632 [Arachis hypogaea]|uniref:poly(A)-specific ribonuclease n=1 Tax=Arachis hypogaea TaxID=3818 RepID=A0A444ZG24_ARAHY|nr:probable CCR4-associated factor 1 homolog 11 [Arachis ipaensis]XP_025646620.1 probable CCR4-associated factor 1 homolog 11 [Arachis hypogaea]QHO06840.1 uncharacterized protein DS421_14g458310 [Arachis hypogaea]RYR13147.1 hypothetical protein Ahy_B04g070290 [Arachis hypogaea]